MGTKYYLTSTLPFAVERERLSAVQCPEGAPSEAKPVTHRDFSTVLRSRLETYFLNHNLSSKAGAAMAFKVIVGLTCWFGAYAGLYAPGVGTAGFLSLYVLQGLAQLFLLLNVTHDSNHNAISRHFVVNRMLSYIMDACGINSRMWRILHHSAHHSCINILGEDDAIFTRGMLRLSPRAPHRAMHKYQFYYAFILYSLFSLDYVLVKDFHAYFAAPRGQLKRFSHRASDIAILFGGKLFYLTYMIALPIILLHRSPVLVLSAFVATHLLLGLVSVIVFQTSHVLESNDFPNARSEFAANVYHVLATTKDYATDNRLVTCLIGALNHHVIHHLCPHVCHTHYRALTAIVKQTAAEYGVSYREHATLGGALSEHCRLLKRLAGAARLAAPMVNT